MSLQCPRCQNPIVFEGPAPREIVCSACGSSIQLDPHATSCWLPAEAPKRLGKFDLLEQLGSGSFGTVYKARDRELDRLVAIKVPRAGSLPEPQDQERFLREARSAAQLKHPGIVALYDAGALDGTLCLVSEFIHGVTLAEYLSAKRLGFRQAGELVAAVADALHYAHQHGVIHRDLKPSNVMLDPEGRPHLMDFGLAKRADEVTMTLEGQVLGTPAYMSPEQARGEVRKVDARSDVYGLGVILYELLTGELPFRGQTRMLLMQVIQDEPKAPRRLNDKIPRDLETICLKAMAKEPGRRYQTAGDVAGDLRRYLNGEPIQARRVGQAERLWRWSKRNPVDAGLIAAVLALLLLVAVVALAGYAREAVQRREAERQEGLAKVEADRAVKAEDHSRRLWYAATLSLIQSAWEDGDLRRFHELMAATADFPDRGFEWYYWKLRSRREHVTLSGHQGSVTVVAFAPDSERVATGGGDGTARLWDANGRPLFPPLRGHRGEVTAVAFVPPDGKRLVTGGVDGTARVWDLVTRKELRKLEGHRGEVWRVAVTPDGSKVVTGGADGTARVWELATGKQLKTLKGHTGWVRSVAVSQDGQQVVTGGQDGTTRLWDLTTGDILGKLDGKVGLDGKASPVEAVAVVPGRQQFVTLSAGTLRDLASGKTLLTLPSASGVFLSLAVSSDGKRVATGAGFGEVALWDLASGRQLRTFHKRNLWVTSVAISPNGNRLAAASSGGEAWVHDLTTDRETVLLKGHKGRITSVAVTPDGKRVVSGSDDGKAWFWDLERGQEPRLFQDPGATPGKPAPFPRGGLCVAISPDGRWLVTGSKDGKPRVWDTTRDQSPRVLEGPGHPLGCVAVSPDGRRVFAGSEDGSAWAWDTASDGAPRRFKGQVGPIGSVAVTADGKRLMTGSADGTVVIWDLEGSQEPRQFKAWDWYLWSAAITPDGRMVAVGSGNGTPKLWDTQSRREHLTIQAHSSAVISVALTPDAKRLVTGGADGLVKVWDAVSGHLLLTLKGHSGRVSEVAVTADGRKLVTSGWDGTVRMWHTASEAEVARWKREEEDADRHRAIWQKPPGEAPDFIRDWLILAPLPVKATDSGDERVHGELVRNEARLRPREGDRVEGRELAWKRYRSPEAVLDFNRAIKGYGTNCVGYAVCYVISDRDRHDLLVQVGSDDQAKVYLNEEPVYSYVRPRVLQDLDPVGPVTLKKGTNVLVVKVVNQGGAWLGCARFVHQDGKPVEGLRPSLTPEP